jgi:hypothetical protein
VELSSAPRRGQREGGGAERVRLPRGVLVAALFRCLSFEGLLLRVSDPDGIPMWGEGERESGARVGSEGAFWAPIIATSMAGTGAHALALVGSLAIAIAALLLPWRPAAGPPPPTSFSSAAVEGISLGVREGWMASPQQRRRPVQIATSKRKRTPRFCTSGHTTKPSAMDKALGRAQSWRHHVDVLHADE